MPEFICREVLAPVHSLGAKPLFYPVNDRLEAEVDPDRLPVASAVMAVNYFGFPQPLDPFRQYARRKGAFLIEDNAHGLFSRDNDNTLLGTRADLGIFSLRKSISLPNGGALTVLRPELIRRFKRSSRFSRSRSDHFYFGKALARRFIRWAGLPGADVVISVSRWIRKIITGHAIPPPNPMGERIMPVPEHCSPLLKRKITTADPHHETKRRRELYRFFLQYGQKFGIRHPIFPKLEKGVAPYGFPFHCSQENFPQLAASLRKHGFLCISWPDLPAAVSDAERVFYRTVRLIPFLW